MVFGDEAWVDEYDHRNFKRAAANEASIVEAVRGSSRSAHSIPSFLIR